VLQLPKGLGTILTQYIRTRVGHSFSSRVELEEWQNRKVEKHLKRILPHSPFYQHWLANRSLAEWRSFPTIHKQIMMDHFDELNTVNIKKEEAFRIALQAEETRNFTPMIDQVTIGLSSGTSGNRGIFLVSQKERWRWSGAMLAKVLPGSLLDSHRVALFLRANSNLYTSVERGRIRFRFFDLIQPIEKHLSDIQEFQPTILVAPPSMLRFLAEAKERGEISIHPKKVISVAEVLDPIDQAVISQVFEQTIHQIYQCTEGFIATTCQYGTLHINEDLLVVQKEILDPELGKFSPIITDFSRTTQPIIRYRLDDILTERKTPCPCGSIYLAIEQIEGRCDDLFYLPALTENRLIPVFPDFIRRAIITAHHCIQEYLVIQHHPTQIEISLKISSDDPEGVREAVQRSLHFLFDQLGCQMPAITWSSYDRRPGTVKLRRVERRYQLEDITAGGFYGDFSSKTL
jgi:putative adenylate-forming enzyme